MAVSNSVEHSNPPVGSTGSDTVEFKNELDENWNNVVKLYIKFCTKRLCVKVTKKRMFVSCVFL